MIVAAANQRATELSEVQGQLLALAQESAESLQDVLSIGGRELARQIAQLDSVLPALHEHLRLALASLEGEQQYVPLADRMTDLLRALDALDTNLRHISEGELQCSGAPQHELAQLFETLQHDSYASFTEDEFGAMELSLHREFRKDGLLDDYVAKRGNVVDQLNYFLIEAQHS